MFREIFKNKKITVFAIFIFVFMLLLNFLTPISGDDYVNYIVGLNIYKVFDGAIGMYFGWEGRFIGRVLIYLLVYYKFVFNIVTAMMISLIFTLTTYLMGKIKNKSIYFLIMISILFVNTAMFAQVYTWVAGTVTYLYPTVLLLLYFIYIYYNKDKEFKKYDLILFTILNIIGTMFVENIGCSLVVGNFLLMLYYFKKDRKKFKVLLFAFILSTISLTVMLLSPGSAARSAANIEFNNLSLYEKIYSNIDDYIKNTFTNNIMLIILVSYVINYTLIKKKINKLYIILYNIIPVLTILTNLRYYRPVKFQFLEFLNFNIPPILDFTRPIYLWFWILFIVLFIYSIYYIFKNKKQKLLILYFLLLTSFSSSLIMLILDTFGPRVVYFTVITIIIISLVTINEISTEKTNKFVIVFAILLIVYYLVFFNLIYKVNNRRINEIYNQAENNITDIKVLANPVEFVWNNNLPGQWFEGIYRNYLGLDEDVDLDIYKLKGKQYFKILIGR